MYLIINYGITHPITSFLISLHDNYFTIYNRVYKYLLAEVLLTTNVCEIAFYKVCKYSLRL